MRRLVLMGLIAALAIAVPASASTFLAMTQGEMVTRADAVIEGQITQLESFWDESGRLIVTEATVRVDRVLAGSAPSFVTVRTAGGQVDDFMVEAHGFPKFEADQHVILFLTDDGGDTVRVLGYQFGHYEVVTRLDGVTLAVPQTDEDFHMVTRNGERVRAPQSVQLDEFVADINRYAKQRVNR